MLIIFDIGANMSFREKSAWIMAVVTAGTYLVYLEIILERAENTPFSEVAYVSTLLWTMGALMVASIVGHILVAIVAPKDIDKTDQRDREIYRFGEYVGLHFIAAGAFLALVLSMAELDHFWIANAIYKAFVLSTLVASATKILAYRRGIHQW